MSDRDCDNCAHHSDGGCSVWECSYEQKEDDTISRQAAIDALKGHRALFCDNTPDTFSKLSYGEKCRVDELDTAISTLVNLPSVQPTQTDTSNTLKALDCVERQAAIDCLCNGKCTEEGRWCDDGDCMPVRRINSLPSAQPEIITCTECKYYDTDTEQCNNDKGLRFIDFGNPERMWCSWAERRE